MDIPGAERTRAQNDSGRETEIKLAQQASAPRKSDKRLDLVA
jgi:hypothetical protein